MSAARDPARLVREATARAMGLPRAWIGGGLVTLGLLGSSVLLALVAGAATYLAVVVGTLASAPPVGEQGDAPALPGEGAAGPAGARPLPAKLRTRFQALHGSVEAMLAAIPEGARDVSFDPRQVARVPEAFREVARRLAALPEGDPAAPALEARLDRLEAGLGRLRDRWSLLAEGGEDPEVEELESAADELEALAELDRPLLPP